MNLKEIQLPVRALLDETTGILKEKVRTNIRLMNAISDLTPIAKGKKIRSTLLFLLAGMNHVDSPHLAEIASDMEMFHLSSLIHDDIVDNSELRRGEKTLNLNQGNFRSVLWGDYLFINAFSSIHGIGSPELMSIVFDAAIMMVEGQFLEIENSFNFNVQLDTYYDIINRKTSSLFAAVARMIPVLMETASPRWPKISTATDARDTYYRFGLDFGAMFQVTDDMLDIFSKESGKDRFRDLAEGKVTLPYILLHRESETDIKDHFLKGRRDELLALCDRYVIDKLCMEKVDEFNRRCLDFLAPFPDSVYKESLLNLLGFIRNRDY